MSICHTANELEYLLGQHLRNRRLNRNVDQKTLAAQAGVSCRALQNLEGGSGSSIKTLISVVRALGCEDWLAAIAPVPSINPITMPKTGKQRKRASRGRQVSRSNLD